MCILRIIAYLENMIFSIQGVLKHRVTEAECVTAQFVFVH